jgi:dihydropyrimidinase
MVFDTVVRGGTLVLPGGPVEADLAIAKGVVAAIGRGLDAPEVIDARHRLVLPGVVDPHVHPIHAEGYGSVSRAGLRGGVTALGHHLYTPPDGDPVAAFEAARVEAGAESAADFVFHVRLNDLARTAPAIAALVAAGSSTFKLFMAYGNRGIQVRDDEIVLAMQAAADAGGTLLFHAENGHVADLLERQARSRGETTLRHYIASRPRWVESEAVLRLMQLVRIAGSRTYLVHLTCAESLAAVRDAKAAGLAVSAETCPHYLLLTAAEADGLGAEAKMSPPLREAADREALWRALADGLLDCVGSDHSAFVREEKEVGADVFDAGFGVPGIGTMLPLLFDRGVHGGRLSVGRLTEVLATEPARAIGIGHRKGALAIGMDADLVLFDPAAPFVVDAADEGERAYYSLYAGWRGRGVVQATYLRGRLAYADGEVVAPPGTGRWIHRPAAARDLEVVAG